MNPTEDPTTNPITFTINPTEDPTTNPLTNATSNHSSIPTALKTTNAPVTPSMATTVNPPEDPTAIPRTNALTNGNIKGVDNDEICGCDLLDQLKIIK